MIRAGRRPFVNGAGLTDRKENPEARDGPVLVLPSGWEPRWTYANLEPKK